MNKRNIISTLLLALIVFIACRKEKATPSGLSDANLFNYAKDTSATVFTYYQNGNLLAPDAASPHGTFRLRFNPRAKSVLDGTLELPAGQIFPDSSLIVKEAINGSTIQVYAIMFKHNGEWIWAEYAADGSVIHGIGQGSASCDGACHGILTNRDHVLSFDLH